jgi:chromosome segregation ATPase
MTLGPIGLQERERLETELPKLVEELRRAESAYAQRKPYFDEWRTKLPSIREEEMVAIRAIGLLQAHLEEMRQRIAWLERVR